MISSSLPQPFFPPEKGCFLSPVKCIFLGWIRHISLEGERGLMWTSSCYLHATARRFLISTLYIFCNCSLNSLSFLANFSERKLWWNVPVCFHRNRKKKTLLFINAGLFKWSRESAVFTGTLLKCSTIFLSEVRLQPGSSSGRKHRKAVPSHNVTARPSYFRLKHLVSQYLDCSIYF